MLFHSLDFAIFLPIVFFLYWFFLNNSVKFQNILIVISSYVFYGWWDWRFLSLIIFSTFIDYSVGKKLAIENQQTKRKVLLWVSIFFNIGILAIFKYYNFFLENFIDAFAFFGLKINAGTLNIILPVGISFYTFQTMSYSIDIYKKKLEPTKDFVAFSAFVCFFPQLVAGPIERATNLLPQFESKRIFNYQNAVDGMQQILWGLFKKVVIADNCAKFANQVFNNSGEMNGSTLVIGVFLFAFQVYGDFSGYSDIAIGTSRLFSFNLKKNFATPYFSRNILEFWKRWHISLTSWLTDYIFTPLAINYRSLGKIGIIASIFITFIFSGLWHGANWTFIMWGLIHTIFYLLTIAIIGHKTSKYVVANHTIIPSIKEVLSMSLTFVLVSFTYVFFRAKDLNHAFSFINGIFDKSIVGKLQIQIDFSLIIFILTFLIVEWIGRGKNHSIQHIFKANNTLRYSFYIMILCSIFWFPGEEQDFIYFQF